MHLLLSAFACAPGQGSEPGNGWMWARTLAARGHQVELLTRSDGRVAIEGELSAHPLPSLRVHYVDAAPQPWCRHRETRRMLEYEAWLTASGRFARTIRGPELAHHVTWGSLHFGPRLDALDLPVVTGPVGGGQVAPRRHRAWFEGEWRDEQIRNLLTRQLLGALPGARRTARTDHVFATNLATAAKLRTLGASRVSLLLAEGVDDDLLDLRCERRLNGAEPSFIWVGSMVPRKAATLALAAFARLVRVRPGARMLFVGDGPGEALLRARVRALDLTDRVDLVGRVPWRQVREHLDRADAFVFSSLRDSSSAQCLEAAARGVPIVAFDQDGICDLLPDEAAVKIGVGTDDLSGALANGMERIVGDAGEWAKRSDAARVWAAGQTWRAKMDAAESVYAELAGVPGSARRASRPRARPTSSSA